MEAKRCQRQASHSTCSSCRRRSNSLLLKGEGKKNPKKQPKCFWRCQVGTVFISEAQSHKSQICLQGPRSLHAVVKSGCVLRMIVLTTETELTCILKCAQTEKRTVIIWSPTFKNQIFHPFPSVFLQHKAPISALCTCIYCIHVFMVVFCSPHPWQQLLGLRGGAAPQRQRHQAHRRHQEAEPVAGLRQGGQLLEGTLALLMSPCQKETKQTNSPLLISNLQRNSLNNLVSNFYRET